MIVWPMGLKGERYLRSKPNIVSLLGDQLVLEPRNIALPPEGGAGDENVEPQGELVLPVQGPHFLERADLGFLFCSGPSQLIGPHRV